jgi:hypothetical protein
MNLGKNGTGLQVVVDAAGSNHWNSKNTTVIVRNVFVALVGNQILVMSIKQAYVFNVL